jgi:hypothetical protein
MLITWGTGTGRKEGSGKREGRDNLVPMDWPTRNEKAPQGEPYGARRKRDFLAIQDWMQGQIRASGGSKGSKELGSQGREAGASQQNMGNGSVGKGSGHEVPFPRIVRRWNGSIPPVFGNESFEQLAHSLTVDFIPG